MSIIRLDSLFRPKSVAVIGASSNPESLGSTVMRNLLNGEFNGPILPVNIKCKSVLGVLCYESVELLPVVPDLAVLCTPPDTVPGLIGKLGFAGTRVAIIMTVNPGEDNGLSDDELKKSILKAARPHAIRVLGPGSVGIIMPHIGLNASWLSSPVKPGRLALVSQSSSLLAGLLKWARANDIGISHVISLGGAIDIDFGDLLDYFAMDGKSRSVILNIRNINNPRKFLSASRAVTRIKPVIIIKTGRRSRTGNIKDFNSELLVSADEAFDAAIRRGGMLRVYDTMELFNAVETLSLRKPLLGECLAIVCNGKVPGEMAADVLFECGGKLTEFSIETKEKICSIVPCACLRNPLDIGRDATASRYREIVSVLLNSREVDALLVLHVSTPLESGDKVAEAVSEVSKQTMRNVMVCRLGDIDSNYNIEELSSSDIPTYITPDEAVRAFMHLVHYKRNQELLMEIPSKPPPEDIKEYEKVRAIIDNALKSGPCCLNEQDTAEILSSYGINTLDTKIALDVNDAVMKAGEIRFPVSLKILSTTVMRSFADRKSSLNLYSKDTVKLSAEDIKQWYLTRYPDREWPGFVVQKMINKQDALMLMIGVSTDPTFGPLIRIGRGGEFIDGRIKHAVALPPLNMSLAGELISRTDIGRILACNPGQISIDVKSLRSALVKISRLIVDVPEMISLNINPLLIDRHGITVLDARLEIVPTAAGEERLAIKPYPHELEENFILKDGRSVFVRPIRPEDEPAYVKLLSMATKKDLKQRFFSMVNELPHSVLARLINIDYDREMAFVATIKNEKNDIEILGVVNIMSTHINSEAEYAILIRSDIQGLGLGGFLMEKIIRYCRGIGMNNLYGLVLEENPGMLGLVKKLGFKKKYLFEENIMEVRLAL